MKMIMKHQTSQKARTVPPKSEQVSHDRSPPYRYYAKRNLRQEASEELSDVQLKKDEDPSDCCNQPPKYPAAENMRVNKHDRSSFTYQQIVVGIGNEDKDCPNALEDMFADTKDLNEDDNQSCQESDESSISTVSSITIRENTLLCEAEVHASATPKATERELHEVESFVTEAELAGRNIYTVQSFTSSMCENGGREWHCSGASTADPAMESKTTEDKQEQKSADVELAAESILQSVDSRKSNGSSRRERLPDLVTEVNCATPNTTEHGEEIEQESLSGAEATAAENDDDCLMTSQPTTENRDGDPVQNPHYEATACFSEERQSTSQPPSGFAQQEDLANSQSLAPHRGKNHDAWEDERHQEDTLPDSGPLSTAKLLMTILIPQQDGFFECILYSIATQVLLLSQITATLESPFLLLLLCLCAILVLLRAPLALQRQNPTRPPIDRDEHDQANIDQEEYDQENAQEHTLIREGQQEISISTTSSTRTTSSCALPQLSQNCIPEYRRQDESWNEILSKLDSEKDAMLEEPTRRQNPTRPPIHREEDREEHVHANVDGEQHDEQNAQEYALIRKGQQEISICTTSSTSTTTSSCALPQLPQNCVLEYRREDETWNEILSKLDSEKDAMLEQEGTQRQNHTRSPTHREEHGQENAQEEPLTRQGQQEISISTTSSTRTTTSSCALPQLHQNCIPEYRREDETWNEFFSKLDSEKDAMLEEATQRQNHTRFPIPREEHDQANVDREEHDQANVQHPVIRQGQQEISISTTSSTCTTTSSFARPQLPQHYIPEYLREDETRNEILSKLDSEKDAGLEETTQGQKRTRRPIHCEEHVQANVDREDHDQENAQEHALIRNGQQEISISTTSSTRTTTSSCALPQLLQHCIPEYRREGETWNEIFSKLDSEIDALLEETTQRQNPTRPSIHRKEHVAANVDPEEHDQENAQEDTLIREGQQRLSISTTTSTRTTTSSCALPQLPQDCIPAYRRQDESWNEILSKLDSEKDEMLEEPTRRQNPTRPPIHREEHVHANVDGEEHDQENAQEGPQETSIRATSSTSITTSSCALPQLPQNCIPEYRIEDETRNEILSKLDRKKDAMLEEAIQGPNPTRPPIHREEHVQANVDREEHDQENVQGNPRIREGKQDISISTTSPTSKKTSICALSQLPQNFIAEYLREDETRNESLSRLDSENDAVLEEATQRQNHTRPPILREEHVQASFFREEHDQENAQQYALIREGKQEISIRATSSTSITTSSCVLPHFPQHCIPEYVREDETRNEILSKLDSEKDAMLEEDTQRRNPTRPPIDCEEHVQANVVREEHDQANVQEESFVRECQQDISISTTSSTSTATSSTPPVASKLYSRIPKRRRNME